MGDEQTDETLWFAVDNIAPTRWPADEVAYACLAALGLDPDMTVECLRADLAIAARVRACRPLKIDGGLERDEIWEATGHNSLLGFLLGDNP